MEQMWITHPREFTFQLFDENNNLIDTKKNTDNGSVLFDSIIFDEVGDYVSPCRKIAPELAEGLCGEYINAARMRVSYGQFCHLNAIAAKYYSCNYPCNYSRGTGIVHSHAGE